MTNTSSISIVIPAYNVEDYLLEALDSIKSQTKYPDEVIIIDDGSIDNTLSIAKSYSFSFPYKVLSVNNGGQGRARNIGAELAKSEYIYYFDSDDLIDKRFIEVIKSSIHETNFPDIIFFSGQTFNDDKYSGLKWNNYNRGFTGYFDNHIELLDKGYRNRGLFCQPCMYISKRSLWGKDKLTFDSNYLEDEAIFFPLIFACKNFYVLDRVFFCRRNRNNSTMTMQPNIKHVNGALHCINEIIKLYNKGNLKNRETWHITRRLEMQCLSYIQLAKKANQKLDLKAIQQILMLSKNPVFFSKLPIYILGLDDTKVFNKIAPHLKYIINLRK